MKVHWSFCSGHARGRLMSFIAAVVFTTFVALLIFPALASAGINEWTSTGPGGGPADEVTLSPDFANDHTAFLSTSNSGLYLSTNGGDSWSQATNGLSASMYVYDVGVSPDFANDHTVFVYGDSKLFKSVDGGSTWSLVNGNMDQELWCRQIDISPDFANDQAIFHGGFRSFDGGVTWTQVNRAALPIAARISGVSFSPAYASDHTIFFYTSPGLSKTVDDGDTFSSVAPATTYFRDMEISPSFSSDNTIFTFESTINKSTDGGASWVPSGAGLPTGEILSLAISPGYSSDGTMFCTTWQAQVYKSTDGGASWSLSPLGPGGAGSESSVTVSPGFTSDSTVFVVARDSVYRTGDAGATWNPAVNGFNNLPVGELAATDNGGPAATIFAATSRGLFKSTDGSQSWTKATSGFPGGNEWLPEGSFSSVAMSPIYNTDNTAYAVNSQYGILKSTDSGGSWAFANNGFPNYWGGITISPAFGADSTIFSTFTSGRYVGGVAKSTDAGASWNQYGSWDIPSGGGCQPVVISPGYAADGTVFADCRSGGIYKSSDGGASWRTLGGASPSTLAISPAYVTDQTIFVGYDDVYSGGIWKVTNGGTTWHHNNSGLGNLGVLSIATSPNFANDRTVFAGTQGGVYVSHDAGDSWSRLGGDFIDFNNMYNNITDIKVSPNFASDRTVFAATTRGVYSYTVCDAAPDLSLVKTGAYWASYADYLARSLSVDYSVGAGTQTAYAVTIAGSTATNGVGCPLAGPVSLGTIAAGSSQNVTVTYTVPPGVNSFRATVYTTAQDVCGSNYSYPGPYPGL